LLASWAGKDAVCPVGFGRKAAATSRGIRGICVLGEKCRVVKPEEVHQLAHCSVEELAAKAARKGDATDSGGMLCAPLKPGDRVIEVLGVGNRLWAPPSALQSGCGVSPA
jgi:hypothetical protein